jgi:hypothetical protein
MTVLVVFECVPEISRRSLLIYFLGACYASSAGFEVVMDIFGTDRVVESGERIRRDIGSDDSWFAV